MSQTATVLDEQIPEFLQVLESALRSGYSLAQSLDLVTKDMAAPMAVEVQRVMDEVQAGVALLQALDQWRERQPSRQLDLVVAAVHAQMEAGGNLANKFQLISQLIPHLKE